MALGVEGWPALRFCVSTQRLWWRRPQSKQVPNDRRTISSKSYGREAASVKRRVIRQCRACLHNNQSMISALLIRPVHCIALCSTVARRRSFICGPVVCHANASSRTEKTRQATRSFRSVICRLPRDAVDRARIHVNLSRLTSLDPNREAVRRLPSRHHRSCRFPRRNPGLRSGRTSRCRC